MAVIYYRKVLKRIVTPSVAYPRRCVAAEAENLFEHAKRLESRDYFDVIYSTSRLVYNMDEYRICGKAEFNAIFLSLRWKLNDFDQIAGWGPV